MTQAELQTLFADVLHDVTGGGKKFRHITSVHKALAWMQEKKVLPTPCYGPGAPHERRPRSALCGPHYQQLHHHRGDMKKLTPLLIREMPKVIISAQLPTWVFDAVEASDPQRMYMRAARRIYNDLALGHLGRKKMSQQLAPDESTGTRQLAIKVGDKLADAVRRYSPRSTIHVAGAKVLTDWASGLLVRRTP